MNKKAIAILGGIFLLIVGTLGFLIYAKYGKKPSDPNAKVELVTNNATSSQPSTNIQPTKPVEPTSPPVSLSNSKIVKLTEDKVVSPALFFDGSGITYFNEQGQLFQSVIQTSDTGLVQLTKKRNVEIVPKSGITKILWPPVGDNFIAEFKNGNKKTWSFFDSQTGAYTDLPAQIYSLDWAPNGQKIYYIWQENNKATLNTADANGKNWRKISDIWATNSQIAISPDGLNVLYFQDNQASSTTNSILQTTPDGKVWQALVKQGYNMGVLWSPDSQKFIFTKKDPNSQKFGLWYYNLFTGEVVNLNTFTTIDKVVWDKNSKVIYAAEPNSGIAGEDSVTEDTFLKYDLKTLQRKNFDGSGEKIDARDMFLNTNSDKLFFRNAQNGFLYYLDLK